MLEDIAPDEIRRRRAIYEPLTDAVRDLVDAAIRTEADADTVAEVLDLVQSATDRLRERQLAGAFGVRFASSGESMPWGNPVIGIRNPIAPPMVIERDDTGAVSSDFTLGAAYEGPTGMVHGGICALLLDHLLGEAASADGSPSLTGEITVRFVRATPLGPLHA
ncbi:MAG: PaaI family thioesterase, partial [Aldersonia sp.]|nr:PaaI family thioesterase [Aldersonia sp.]